jgi:hypothetical protein
MNKEIQAVQVSAASSATRESLLTLKSQDADDDTASAGNRKKSKPEVTLQDEMKEISQRP